MSEWQLIETAPKVTANEPILVYTESAAAQDGEDMFLAYWREDSWRIHIDGQRIEPTYWMPRPRPPIEGAIIDPDVNLYVGNHGYSKGEF